MDALAGDLPAALGLISFPFCLSAAGFAASVGFGSSAGFGTSAGFGSSAGLETSDDLDFSCADGFSRLDLVFFSALSFASVGALKVPCEIN